MRSCAPALIMEKTWRRVLGTVNWRGRDCGSGCDGESEQRRKGNFCFLECTWHLPFVMILGRKLPLVCFPDGNFLPERLRGSSWAIDKRKNLVALFPLLCSSLVLLPSLLWERRHCASHWAKSSCSHSSLDIHRSLYATFLLLCCCRWPVCYRVYVSDWATCSWKLAKSSITNHENIQWV